MGKRDSNGKQQREPTTPMVLDLSDFVKEVDRFSRLIEPFALVFYTIDDLRRWRFFKGTIALWLACNLACLILTQGAAFVLASAVVIGVATIALFQLHTQILSKLLPSNKLSTQDDAPDDGNGALDTVQNFRYSLIAVHDFVVKSNEYLNYFYSILRWDAVAPSALYHLQACIFLLSLVVCPARWNCFIFVNWFFLCHPHILKRLYGYIQERSGQSSSGQGDSKGNAKEASATKETKSSEADEKDNCEADDMDMNEGADSDLDLTDEVGDKSMIALDPAPSKPGMVARFMEIKKRRKQIASESCLSCNVSFGSVLKTRLYCRHCGYSFCNRCCYQKVPRSVFGATSPAAMKETVVVCCSCHQLLSSQGSQPNLSSDPRPESQDIG